MVTAAEQYRALVAKLEAINPSEPISEAPLPYGTTAPAEAPAEAPAAAPAPVAAPAPAATTIQQQIEHAPTFKQAYAMAKKAGLKTFKWCQCKEYAVKDAPPAQGGMMPGKNAPAPEKKVDYLGQEDPLGGTMSNPMSFASNSNFGA